MPSELDRRFDAVLAQVIGPGGRLVIERDSEGRAIVAWDEISGGARRVRLRIGDQPSLTLSTGNASSYPAVVAAGSAVVAAWTDQSNGGSVVRVTRVH